MDIVLVSSYSGDWVGLYVDGDLKAEGHRLTEYQVLRALDFEVREIETPEEWLRYRVFGGFERGCLPCSLSEVPDA